MDIVRAFQMVHSVKLALQDVRDEVDQDHSKWFQQAINLASGHGVEPPVPRTCKRQTQRENTEANGPEEYYRRTLTITDYSIR